MHTLLDHSYSKKTLENMHRHKYTIQAIERKCMHISAQLPAGLNYEGDKHPSTFFLKR
jgi:hypothetical protein